jgi:hypothetical protein
MKVLSTAAAQGNRALIELPHRQLDLGHPLLARPGVRVLHQRLPHTLPAMRRRHRHIVHHEPAARHNHRHVRTAAHQRPQIADNVPVLFCHQEQRVGVVQGVGEPFPRARGPLEVLEEVREGVGVEYINLFNHHAQPVIIVARRGSHKRHRESSHNFLRVIYVPNSIIRPTK